MFLMKNVITVVVDAFCYKNLERRVGYKEVTPFLNSLAKKSLCFTNMHSQAPYTEASLISLLGGENTLENGGYLFGNANIKNSIFKDYKEAGYHTILGYSPYVYSKAYLRDVTDYKYTRLYTIRPCFDYRFNYFKDKKINNEFQDDYYSVCSIILEEAFETWKLQCNSLLNKEETSEMILPFIRDMNSIITVKNGLVIEEEKYKENKKEYIESILSQWNNHKLIDLDKIYNEKKELKLLGRLKERYNDKLLHFQKIYEQKILKGVHIDFNYVFKTFCGSKDKKDFLRLIKSYCIFKKNKDLENYLNNLNAQSKCEVSMQTMFECFKRIIKSYDEKNENYYLYFQPQDFHLPSLFHSFDSEDECLTENEFEAAFSLLNSLDSTYKGNIIADLSAHFCDLKLEQFYTQLKDELKNEFIFVVVADHGYPSYYNPPRPIIYNQTYTEAFHIPCLINGSSVASQKKNGLYSVIDGVDYVKHYALELEKNPNVQERKYILSEYAGPGCPLITEKKIWYSLITKEQKLSAEVSLGKEAEYTDIKDIYDLMNDPDQKYNLRKSCKKCPKINEFLKVITKRSLYLGKRFLKETYLKDLINLINSQKIF